MKMSKKTLELTPEPLCRTAEDEVEKLLSFCVSCLTDLHPDYRCVECPACSELRCYTCECGCLCDRKKSTKG